MPENKSSPPQNRTGVISIIKVLQHFGVKDLQSVYEKNPETDDQLNWDKLQSLAKKYNISSTLIRPTVDELREIEYPAVAKMNDGAYIALGSANDEVVLAIDPRENKPRAIPIKDFLEAWSNELLIFSAAFSWTYFKKRYNVDWFLRVMKRYKKPLIEVLVASFFLQLMGIGHRQSYRQRRLFDADGYRLQYDSVFLHAGTVDRAENLRPESHDEQT